MEVYVIKGGTNDCSYLQSSYVHIVLKAITITKPNRKKDTGEKVTGFPSSHIVHSS